MSQIELIDSAYPKAPFPGLTLIYCMCPFFMSGQLKSSFLVPQSRPSAALIQFSFIPCRACPHEPLSA